MHTDTHGAAPHHKPRHMAEKVEGMLGYAMVIAIVLLGIGLVYGLMTTGSGSPAWMK